MGTEIPDFEALLTTDEVLAQLKMTPRRLYRLIRGGDLPAVRIGRQWRFRPRDVEGWVDRQREGCNGELNPTAECAPAGVGAVAGAHVRDAER